MPGAQGARPKHHSQELPQALLLLRHSLDLHEEKSERHRDDGRGRHWQFLNFCFTLNRSRLHLLLHNYFWRAQIPKLMGLSATSSARSAGGTRDPAAIPAGSGCLAHTTHSRDPQSPHPGQPTPKLGLNARNSHQTGNT